jgi:hypothetical protein
MSKQEIIPEFPKEFFKYLLVLIGFAVLVIYASIFVKVSINILLTIVGFIIIGAISRLPQRLSYSAFGFELCTLVTISGAIMYGPVVGVIIGVLSTGISGFYTIEPPHDIIIMVIGFALIGWFAVPVYAYFGALGITALVITVLYDLGTNLLYVMLGHSWANSIKFTAMHIPSNYLLLKYLGPKLIGL